MVSRHDSPAAATTATALESKDGSSDFGCDFIVEKSADGVLVEGAIPAGQTLQWLLHCLTAVERSLQRAAPGRFAVSIRANRLSIMRCDIEEKAESAELSVADQTSVDDSEARLGHDVVDSDDLISVPPKRPSRKLMVRLNKRGKDRPQPAEDPWA